MLGVIINTKAGKKAYLVQRYYLFSLLEKRGEDYCYRITQYASHAGELARELAEQQGIRRFLILGGDGTISEVINGLMHARIPDPENLSFGFMPRGTGNDYGRCWAITKNYREALARFFDGKPQPVDIGRISYYRNGEQQFYYFVNSVGFGVDARTCDYTSVLKYYVGSHSINYFFSLLVAVMRHKPQLLHIHTAEGFDLKENLYAMNIAVGPYCGGGIQLNPDANPSDGLFHAMFVKVPTFRQILQALPHVFDGKLIELPFIYRFISSSVVLQAPEMDDKSGQRMDHLMFEADGIICHTSGDLHIDCLHHALKLVC